MANTETCFDETKYVYWAQDANFKPTIVNRREMAVLLNVSTQTIDNWIIYKGAPVRNRGRGAAVEICTQEFIEWTFAHRLGITVEAWRDRMIKEGLKAREATETERLEAENQRLREQLAALQRAAPADESR
jgi:phage terminase Nu1 subunit (DNA packaging protein)